MVFLSTGNRCGEVITVAPILLTTLTPGLLSAPVTVNATLAPHVPASLLTTMGAAGQVMVGFSLSLTVTVKLQAAVWPAASVATLSTVVVPTGNRCGEVITVAPILLTTLTPGQLSAPVTVNATLAPHVPASLLTTMGAAGQVMVGFSLSLTVTVKLQAAVWPAASVATLSTVVVPTGDRCGVGITGAPL